MKNCILMLTVLFISIQTSAQAKLLEGEVVEVIDGDTFKLRAEQATYKISLAGVVCPELMQPFGDEAKQFTSDAILNKLIKVWIVASAPKEHFMGIVHYDSVNLSRELLINGLAWYIVEFNSSDFLSKSSSWQILEDEAKSNKIGLWQDTNPINPKEWIEANSIYHIYPGCEKKQNNAERKNCMSNKIKKFVDKKFNKNLVGHLGLHGLQKIKVEFNINKEGNIVDIVAIAKHPKLEEEAIRVFKKIPKIKPKYINGKPVETSHSLPINFNVSGNK